MTLQACYDASPARWIMGQDRDWGDLAARGPVGFESYARLRFIPDPAFVGQRESDAEVRDLGGPDPSENWQIGVAMEHMEPDAGSRDCYLMVWEGWPDIAAEPPTGPGASLATSIHTSRPSPPNGRRSPES